MAWSGLSRHERGYGSEWVKVRAFVLGRDMHTCQPCKRKGRLSAATEVDHIVSKALWIERFGTNEGMDDEENLQSICSPCHLKKTNEEKGFKSRPRIGVDGYPLED